MVRKFRKTISKLVYCLGTKDWILQENWEIGHHCIVKLCFICQRIHDDVETIGTIFGLTSVHDFFVKNFWKIFLYIKVAEAGPRKKGLGRQCSESRERWRKGEEFTFSGPLTFYVTWCGQGWSKLVFENLINSGYTLI